MKERWKEMLEYQQKVQAMTNRAGMTDLERADARKLLDVLAGYTNTEVADAIRALRTHLLGEDA